MDEYSHLKLTELDWDVLDGLQTVLHVSHLLNQWAGTHVTTDSSPISTTNVV